MEGSLPWRGHCPLLLAGFQSIADVCSHHEEPVSEQVRATKWKGPGLSMPADQPHLSDIDVALCSVEEAVAKEDLKPHGSRWLRNLWARDLPRDTGSSGAILTISSVDRGAARAGRGADFGERSE